MRASRRSPSTRSARDPRTRAAGRAHDPARGRPLGLGVFVVALVVRAVLASRIVFPSPEDTAYYVGVARNLVDGRGLVTDALWSYGTPPLVFPRPAFEVWLPLPDFLAALPMALFGATFAAAQLPFVIIGAMVPVLAWRLAADVAAERGFDRTGRALFALGTGPHGGGLPPAPPPLRAPRFDDAVRRPGAGRVSADGPHRPRDRAGRASPTRGSSGSGS